MPCWLSCLCAPPRQHKVRTSAPQSVSTATARYRELISAFKRSGKQQTGPRLCASYPSARLADVHADVYTPTVRPRGSPRVWTVHPAGCTRLAVCWPLPSARSMRDVKCVGGAPSAAYLMNHEQTSQHPAVCAVIPGAPLVIPITTTCVIDQAMTAITQAKAGAVVADAGASLKRPRASVLPPVHTIKPAHAYQAQGAAGPRSALLVHAASLCAPQGSCANPALQADSVCLSM